MPALTTVKHPGGGAIAPSSRPPLLAISGAYAMLGMSVVALVLIAVFCRQKIGSGAMLVALVAGVTATIIVIVTTTQ
jgi:hypothetical protein